MESVARLGAAERRELFTETATRKGMTPAIVEKDFWVCWTLRRLFAHRDLLLPRRLSGQIALPEGQGIG
jgi:hypothetical protein